MKRLLLAVLLFIFLLPSVVFAWERNYQCTSKHGTESGYGRPSNEGEYSSYWKKKAKEGEYIIFQYKPGGKKYWFYAEKCKKLQPT
jgi:hypothetical protein